VSGNRCTCGKCTGLPDVEDFYKDEEVPAPDTPLEPSAEQMNQLFSEKFTGGRPAPNPLLERCRDMLRRWGDSIQAFSPAGLVEETAALIRDLEARVGK
jgi:hypothetical protein